MKRRIIAALMALCLCIGLLPATALAAGGSNTATGDYISLDYGTGSADIKITVNVFYDGEQIDTFTVNDGARSGNEMEIRLLETQKDLYDIESVDINPGGGAILTGSADSWDLGIWSVFDNPDVVIDVTLCDQYEPPEIVNKHDDWYDLTLEYRLYEPQMLELLYLNGDADVNKDTTVSSIDVHFVDSYGISEDADLNSLPTGANNLPYRYMTLSDVGDKGNPDNIRYLEITYDNNDGRGEKTVKIYSGDLRYVGKKVAGFPIYEIEARDDSESIVAFYIEEGAELSTWSLYDVEFVKDGEALGYDRMPEDPTFPNTQYVFTNWDKNVTGGAPFLPYDPVTDHTVVYAQKTSTSGYGGTEYHAMNTGNALLDRFLELYNTNHNTEYGLNDIDLDSVKIQVNGLDSDATNPNYWNNHWKNNNAYYRIVNSTINLGWQSDTVSNTHVPHEQAQSITIYADVDGTSVEVVIPCGTNPGEIGKSLVQDNIVQLIVNAPPTAPDDEDLTDDPDAPDDTAILGEGAVTVDCINNKAEHDPVTYGLIPGSYTALTDEDVYWANDAEGNGAYYVDITDIAPGAYVTAYNTDVASGHSLSPANQENKTITLKWVDSSWEVVSTVPVTFTVTCDTSSGGDLADNQIAIEVYLDGQQVEDENTFSNYVSHTSGPASDGTTGIGAWDADLDAYVYTYGEDTPDSAYVNLTVTHRGTDTIVQGIEAHLVYGDGDPNITDQEDTFSLNNVTMRSTVKIYLNTVYTVAYSVPAGTAEPTDDGTYITVAALESNGNDLPVVGGSSVEYRWINGAVGNDASGTYHTQITLAAVPTGLTGWSIGGTTYSSPVQVSAVAGKADENHVITFTATTSGNPPSGSANVTVTKAVTKVGDTAIPADAAQEDIPAALAGDEIVWTITVQNVGGSMQDKAVTITENLDGAVIAQPAAPGDYYTVSDDGTTITVSGLPAGETETITVTYTVTAADVEAGTAIKNRVTVDDGDAPETVEPDEDVPVVEADILDVPKISHQVNTDPWHNSADTATVEHLVTTTNPAISYQAVLDLSAMELQNTSNTNQSVGIFGSIFDVMSTETWNKLKANYWGLLDYDDTIINLYVKFDSQLDVTETAMQNVTVNSPYFDRVQGDAGKVEQNADGYWVIPCQANAQVDTNGYTNPDQVILSGITLYLDTDAQNKLSTTKVLTITSGGYIDGTVTFGSALSTLNPLTVYGEAADDVVNLALDAWDEKNDSETGGDGTPDYQQALIKYVSANTSYGTVNPATEVVTLTGMTGNTGTATISGSTASANSGYSFTNWTNTAGLSAVTSAILGAQTFTAQGGSTYTFTANFTSSGGSDPGTGGIESDPYLRFDSNGGTEFDPIDENGRDFSINVYDDDHYGTHIPTRPGYRFTGWYTTNTLRTRIDEDEILRVTSYRTVFAGWEETSVPSMLNGDDHYAYIQGYSDGTVRPNANITRAQVATIFFRLLDEDVRDDNLTTYNTFPDVDEDYWANTAISTMASLGVINGRNSGLFDPDAYITRAEFAAICARFDDSGVDGITTFTDTVGHWAEDEISRAAALGWIQGYSDGTFRPNQYITRAQAVTMINRVLCRLPETEDDLLTGMNTWTDCHVTDWFYLAIQEATNSHDFVAKDRVYESWTDLNRDPDWSRYE